MSAARIAIARGQQSNTAGDGEEIGEPDLKVTAAMPDQEIETRRCSRCRAVKPIGDFPLKDRARGTRRSYCWDCCRAYARSHYARNRDTYLRKARRRNRLDRETCQQLAYDHLTSHPCIDCGETDITVLDFDHRDPASKSYEVVHVAARKPWARALAEIAKCDVRCANCHRKRTAEQYGWRRRGDWRARLEGDRGDA